MNKLKLELHGEQVAEFLQDAKDLGRLQEENDRLRNVKHELERKLLAQAKPVPNESLLPNGRPEIIKQGVDLIMSSGIFYSDKKIGIIRGVRLLTGWTLKECKEYVESFPLHNPKVAEQ